MSAVMEEDFERWTARRNAALVLALVMSVTSMAAMAGPVEDGRPAAKREVYAEAMKSFRKGG